MAGARLYGRRCRVTIANANPTPGDYLNPGPGEAIEINGGDDPLNPGLRVQFKITKTDEKEPNTSQIVVTNLSPTRRSSLRMHGVRVTLDAGYVDSGMSRIFAGDARSIDHVRNGPDWDSTFRLGDGERAYQYARLSESFAPGTGGGDVLRRLAGASGLAVGNADQAVADLNQAFRFDQGYSVQGPVLASIDRLTSSLGYRVSVQDGALQVLFQDEVLGAQVPEITPETGLVGSPEMGAPTKKGKPALLKFRSLLTPLRPGGKVKIRSERYDGFVKVKKVEYTGDSRGGDWYVDAYALLLGK